MLLWSPDLPVLVSRTNSSYSNYVYRTSALLFGFSFFYLMRQQRTVGAVCPDAFGNDHPSALGTTGFRGLVCVFTSSLCLSVLLLLHLHSIKKKYWFYCAYFKTSTFKNNQTYLSWVYKNIHVTTHIIQQKRKHLGGKLSSFFRRTAVFRVASVHVFIRIYTQTQNFSH